MWKRYVIVVNELGFICAMMKTKLSKLHNGCKELTLLQGSCSAVDEIMSITYTSQLCPELYAHVDTRVYILEPVHIRTLLREGKPLLHLLSFEALLFDDIAIVPCLSFETF